MGFTCIGTGLSSHFLKSNLPTFAAHKEVCLTFGENGVVKISVKKTCSIFNFFFYHCSEISVLKDLILLFD